MKIYTYEIYENNGGKPTTKYFANEEAMQKEFAKFVKTIVDKDDFFKNGTIEIKNIKYQKILKAIVTNKNGNAVNKDYLWKAYNEIKVIE